jgi:hypothetical protein
MEMRPLTIAVKMSEGSVFLRLTIWRTNHA